jgi:hypothetical protein
VDGAPGEVGLEAREFDGRRVEVDVPPFQADRFAGAGAAVCHEGDERPPPAAFGGDTVDLVDREGKDLLTSDGLGDLDLQGGVLVDEVVLDAEPVDHPEGAEDRVPPRFAGDLGEDALDRLGGDVAGLGVSDGGEGPL